MSSSLRWSDAAVTPHSAAGQQRAEGLEVDAQDFSELFENANDIILITDREGGIVAANRAARELGGYTQEEVGRGVTLRDVMSASEAEAAMLVTERALDGLPIPEVYEREVQLRDGGRRVIELRSNVLRRQGRPWALQTIGRDVTEKREAAAFQTSLLHVSQALLTAQSLDEIGRVICEEASRVLHVDGVYLWLRRGDEVIGCAAAGPNAAAFIGLRRRLSDSVVGRIYGADDVLVVNDFPHSPYAVRQRRGAPVQALLAVPLRRSDPAAGVLVFADSHNPQRFTRPLYDQAVIFGAQATIAIESALARKREEEEGYVSAALLHVARDIRECIEETAVLPQIARSARMVLQCDWTAVALWDAGLGAFQVTTTEGWSAAAAAELGLLDHAPGNSELVDTLLAQQTVEIAEPRGHLDLFRRWQISSFLAVPMSRSGRVIGALVVGFRERCGPFSTRERRIAEGVAAQAAVAVENARLVQDLRHANRLKSEFLGTISHELRTPLSAILGYAELLQEGLMGPLGGEQSYVVDRVLANGRGLLELINMTLDVNRLEAGRVAVEPSEFWLAEVLTELCSEFDAHTAADDVALVWPVEPIVPLFTDRTKLKVIVRNLIGNALKFTTRGSVTASVRFDASRGRLQLSVQDTGVGIPADKLSTVFEMFRQLGAGRGGVGLGLHLVRRYTELLGGEVRVESTPGKGSTFTVDIPARLE